jgi:hypothetical protein
MSELWILVPPWLQSANWHQSNACNYTHSNQKNVGISTYMAVESIGTQLYWAMGSFNLLKHDVVLCFCLTTLHVVFLRKTIFG